MQLSGPNDLHFSKLICPCIVFSQAIVSHDMLEPTVALSMKFMVEFFQLLIASLIGFNNSHLFSQ